jgi:hypothetical protein
MDVGSCVSFESKEVRAMQDEADTPRIIPVSAFLSPSLGRSQANAYELKYLVDHNLGREIQRWAAERLLADPHGDVLRNGSYLTTTLYCDTPQLDVFHKSPSFRRRKFRLRRYGSGMQAFLERKSKTGRQVRKKRTSIPLTELHFLENPVSTGDWDGYWFHRRLLLKGLAPVCALSYERTALGKSTDAGNVRLTLDRHLKSQRLASWTFPKPDTGIPVLAGRTILELKYQDTLPVLFKELLELFRLQPSGHSKYRSALQAWGVTTPRVELAYA